MPSLVNVVFEDHSGEGAVGVWFLNIIAGQIGEILHVDLDGGCADPILVGPGAGLIRGRRH